MYQAPPSRRPLLALGPIGENRGPWMAEIEKGGVVKGITEITASQRPCTGETNSRAIRRRNPVMGAPWDSLAVRSFGARLLDPELASAPNAPSAMILQNQQGVVLQAVGEPEDHKVAGQTVGSIMKDRTPCLMDSTPPRTRKGTPAPSALVRAGSSMQAPCRRDRIAFGAVYEHRDCMGKPKLIASTGIVPERQFQLDWQENRVVRDLAMSKDSSPGSNAHLVWVGVGTGPVGEDEMHRVRQAVVDARSERLKIEKLQSEKPYSRHF